MSRLVCWTPELDKVAKRVFVAQMRRQAEFCGLDVVTYCVMNNHFHILVRVPDVKPLEISNAELVRRYRVMYPDDKKRGRIGVAIKASVLEGILLEGGERAKSMRGELLARMHDVSAFMRELKQRFSIWYNHRHQRHGTLWSERFRSVLVEGSRSALKIVSAYIDLNPVRAGLVQDPKDYIWSGYGAACGGNRSALFGLVRMMGGDTGRAESLRRSLADYRVLLYGKGVVPGPGKQVCLDAEVAQKVMAAGGNLTVSQLLLCRLRIMRDGIVFGTRDYVANLAEARWRDLKRKREKPPVPLPAIAGESLFTLKGSRPALRADHGKK